MESLGGVAQVVLTWFLFTMMYAPAMRTGYVALTTPRSLVLYMIYFPDHLKYSEVDIAATPERPPMHLQTTVKTDEWRLAITLSWVVAAHMCVSGVPSSIVQLKDVLQSADHLRYLPSYRNEREPRHPRTLDWFLGPFLCRARGGAVPSTTGLYMEHQACGRAQHSDDVYPDSGRGRDGHVHCDSVRFLTKTRHTR